ncbi:hypothetical protein ABT369_39565 [Dactylosporangium sp. NPDC000244]
MTQEVDCPDCHGEGVVFCHQGCHKQDCDACDGTGAVEVEVSR